MLIDLIFLMICLSTGYCLRKTCCSLFFFERREDTQNLIQPLPPALVVPIILRCSAYSDFKTEPENTSHESCAICIDHYENDSTVAILEKCNHMYHEECISEWLKKSTACPMCNA